MSSRIGTLRRALPLVALTIAAALVVLLGRANQSLRSQQQELIEQFRYPHPGVYVPLFTAETLAGDSAAIGGRPDSTGSQLLFFFSTTCPYCLHTMPVWNDIFARLSGDTGTEVLGIGLDSLHLVEMYAHDHGLDFPVIPVLDRRIAELYRVRAVPLTLLVDADGRVAYARRGPFRAGEQVDSVLLAVRALRARAVQGSSGAEKRQEGDVM